MQLLISNVEIQKRVSELAQQIEHLEEWACMETPPVFICVLNGGFMFFKDLVQAFHGACQIDFIRAKSYKGQDNSGGVHIVKDIELDISGKRVYIVDDIIDSGNTMQALCKHLTDKGAADIKLVTLLKRAHHTHDIDFNGFDIGDEWVLGYGMDHEGINRNLENIYGLNKD